jgi:radical SAM protein with 4Fe4S-binding SPASM domain
MRVPCLPVTLDIEPNNDCNFQCPHCQVTHWAKRRFRLGRDSFERLLDQFPKFAALKLQGMGEPLLNNEMLPMLRAGEARGIPMHFISNGSVMTLAIAEKLLSLRSTRMTFSIDGATAAVFERVRVGGNFERVCENVRQLVRLRGQSSEPPIDVWTVVTKENVRELPDVVRLAKDLGVDAITFQLFVSNWGKPEMNPHAEAVRVSRTDPDLEAILRQAQHVATRVGIPLTIHRDNFLSRERPCRWPWTSAFIASNGDVVPCSIVADSDTVCMGNVFEQPFREIWNGPAYQHLREQIRTHRLPDFCRACYDVTAVKPSVAGSASHHPHNLRSVELSLAGVDAGSRKTGPRSGPAE